MKQKTQFISLQLLPPLMKFYPQTEVKVILFLSDITPASSSLLCSSWVSWFRGLVWCPWASQGAYCLFFFFTMLLLLACQTRACNCFGISVSIKQQGSIILVTPDPRDIRTTAQYKWYRWGSVEKPLQPIVHLPPHVGLWNQYTL